MNMDETAEVPTHLTWKGAFVDEMDQAELCALVHELIPLLVQSVKNNQQAIEAMRLRQDNKPAVWTPH